MGCPTVARRCPTVARPLRGRCPAVVRPLRGRCPAVARPLPGGCPTVARALRGRCPAVVRPLRGRCAGVARPLPDRCPAVARPLRGRCPAVVRALPGGCAAVGRRLRGRWAAVARPLPGRCPAVVRPLWAVAWAVARPLGGGCPTVARPLPGGCAAVARRLGGRCPTVARPLPDRCPAVARPFRGVGRALPGGCAAVVRPLSGPLPDPLSGRCPAVVRVGASLPDVGRRCRGVPCGRPLALGPRVYANMAGGAGCRQCAASNPPRRNLSRRSGNSKRKSRHLRRCRGGSRRPLYGAPRRLGSEQLAGRQFALASRVGRRRQNRDGGRERGRTAFAAARRRSPLRRQAHSSRPVPLRVLAGKRGNIAQEGARKGRPYRTNGLSGGCPAVVRPFRGRCGPLRGRCAAVAQRRSSL